MISRKNPMFDVVLDYRNPVMMDLPRAGASTDKYLGKENCQVLQRQRVKRVSLWTSARTF